MTTNEHPMPASPLPWALCDASLRNCTCGMVWAADGETLVHMGSVLKGNADRVEGHEGMVKNAAYIEWAANNAPSLAAENARLRAALEEIAQDNKITGRSLALGPLFDAGFDTGWDMARDAARAALEAK